MSADTRSRPDCGRGSQHAPLGAEAEERGEVGEVADGIARVSGLPSARLGEVVLFEGGRRGFVLALEQDGFQAVFLDPMQGVAAGSAVERGGELLQVPVGEALLGRVVDPLGRPLDDGPAINGTRDGPDRAPRPFDHRARLRLAAAADRPPGRRRALRHRPRPARADHRRARHRQDLDRRRRDPEPEGQRHRLRLRLDRPARDRGAPRHRGGARQGPVRPHHLRRRAGDRRAGPALAGALRRHRDRRTGPRPRRARADRL